MADGIILGILTWLSFVFSFRHFPLTVKNFLLQNFFIADILSIAASFLLLTSISKSLIAAVAAMTCGLLVNLTLFIYKEYKKNFY